MYVFSPLRSEFILRAFSSAQSNSISSRSVCAIKLKFNFMSSASTQWQRYSRALQRIPVEPRRRRNIYRMHDTDMRLASQTAHKRKSNTHGQSKQKEIQLEMGPAIQIECGYRYRYSVHWYIGTLVHWRGINNSEAEGASGTM